LCQGRDKKWRLDKAADPKQRAKLDAQWTWMGRMWQLVNIGFPGMTTEAACAALDASFKCPYVGHGRRPILARSNSYEKLAEDLGDVPV